MFFPPCVTPLPLYCIMSFLQQQIQGLSISLNHSSLISVIIRYWLLQEAKSWWYVRRQLAKHLLSTVPSDEPNEFNMRYRKRSLTAPSRARLQGIAGDCRSVDAMAICCVKMGFGGRKWSESFWEISVAVVNRCKKCEEERENEVISCKLILLLVTDFILNLNLSIHYIYIYLSIIRLWYLVQFWLWHWMTKFNVNSTSKFNINLMSNTDVSWHWYLLVLGCVTKIQP